MSREIGMPSDAGFSLLETLIAVFILALLAGGGTVMLTSTLEGRRQMETRASELRALDLASSFLRQDLNAAVPRATLPLGRFGNEESLYGGIRRGDELVLGLVRSGWSDLTGEAPRSDLLLVEYRLEEGVFSRRTISRPDATRATPTHDQTLLSGVVAFEIGFLTLGQRVERWGNATQSAQRKLPDAVELAFTFSDGETLRQAFLVGGRL